MDRDSHRRCQCCGARVESGRGFFHNIGVSTADPSMDLPIRVVRVLTCASRYCVSRKGPIAASL